MALFVTGLLLVVGMLLLDNVLSVATNVVDVKQKNQIFDAAEAGLNSALDLLWIASPMRMHSRLAQAARFRVTISPAGLGIIISLEHSRNP